MFSRGNPNNTSELIETQVFRFFSSRIIPKPNLIRGSLIRVITDVYLGMVLTGSPYFNEAGYDKQIGTSNGQLNSKNYNELVIVRLCDHIVASIRYVAA